MPEGGHEALAERILEYVRVAEREVFAWPVREREPQRAQDGAG